MKFEKIQLIIVCIITVLVPTISDTRMNLALKSVFFLFVIIEIILYVKFGYKNNEQDGKEETKRQLLARIAQSVLACIICAMFVLAVLDVDINSILSGSRDKSLDSTSTSNDNSELDIQSGYDSTVSALNQEVLNIDGENTRTKEMLLQLTEVLDEERTYFACKEDEEEISKIFAKIEEKAESALESVPNLLSDVNSVEIFYKTSLSSLPYHFCNIIKALEEYGIDCEAMDIDEFTLINWDMEYLFLIYSAKYDTRNDVWENVYYDYEKKFNLDDYKVSINEYSDTFNYGNWGWTLENEPVEKIDDIFDEIIMNFYSKFFLNFSE